jgi:serine/threonine protein kinase
MTALEAPRSDTSRRWRFGGDVLAPGRVALHRIGGGGDYEVYAVWDDRLCAPAAAKLIRPDRLDDAGPRRRLAREADLLSELVHPGLPRCYDLDLDAAVPHLLLELVEGPALNRLVRRDGPLDVVQVASVGVQVAGVLHFMAINGYVHLDVKPGNVIMTAAPKLIDLSLARTIEDAARIDAVTGTRSYLAPEQCLASEGALVGPPADVWGLGVTMYYALAGRRPFDDVEWDRVPADEYPQVTCDPRPLDASVPDHLAQLVYDCLSPDPRLRPTPPEIVIRIERELALLAPASMAQW